jgi:hypothetical protein
MSDVGRVQGALGDPADGDHAAPACQLTRERQANFDLGSRRRTVRGRGAGMRWHDVPEQDGSFELELSERAVNDRRGRLAGGRAADLALRRERDSRDARTSVAGRFADEQDRCVGALSQVVVEALRQALVAVLVERVADPCRGEPVYQCSQWTTSPRGRRI